MDENKELYKFLYNPQYREHVITKIHKEEDKAYERRIKVCEKQKRKQIKDRELEIDRIEKSRWQDIGGKISVNNIEKKIKINNKDVLFSSVKGAEINVIYGTRAETTSNEKVKTKKIPLLEGLWLVEWCWVLLVQWQEALDLLRQKKKEQGLQ